MYRNFYELFSKMYSVLILNGFLKSEMLVSQCRRGTATRRTVQKSILQKIRFIHIFQSSGILSDGGCQCLQTDRATLKIDDQSLQNATVNLVETVLIYFQKIECKYSYFVSDPSIVFYLCEITHSLEKAICKTSPETC